MKPLVTALAPLPPAAWLRPPSARLPYPLRDPQCRLFSRGRQALWHGLRASGLTVDDEVLVPAYHHGSEVETLVRAGLRCRFYDATETMEPDEGELRRLLGPRTRALYVTHHLGFPQDVARWRAWCDERDLLLIEDAAQAWLSVRDNAPIGSLADIAIFCLYKTFGLPDGAALRARALPAPRQGVGALGVGAVAFDHALWLTTRSALLSRIAERSYRRRPYVPERDFALGDPDRPPSVATLVLLPRLVVSDAAARRRSNYERLRARLRDLAPQAFRRLPPGAAPLVFPIAATNKPDLLDRLRTRGIRPIDLWSVPHPALAADAFPGAAALRRHLLGLPVHQELENLACAFVADTVAALTDGLGQAIPGASARRSA